MYTGALRLRLVMLMEQTVPISQLRLSSYRTSTSRNCTIRIGWKGQVNHSGVREGKQWVFFWFFFYRRAPFCVIANTECENEPFGHVFEWKMLSNQQILRACRCRLRVTQNDGTMNANERQWMPFKVDWKWYFEWMFDVRLRMFDRKRHPEGWRSVQPKSRLL